MKFDRPAFDASSVFSFALDAFSAFACRFAAKSTPLSNPGGMVRRSAKRAPITKTGSKTLLKYTVFEI